MPNADEEEEDLSESEEGEMLKADEDALRAIRTASTALQERWPEGESPRSWKGVTWSDDRVQELDLERFHPEVTQLEATCKLEQTSSTHMKQEPAIAAC